MPLDIMVVPVTPFQQNCSLVWCTATRTCAVIDPGGELDRLLALIDEKGLTLEKILLTHAHLDHAAGTEQLQTQTGVPIEGPHPDDQFLIDTLPEDTRRYGFPPAKPFSPTRWLHNGDSVTVGEVTLDVYHCPGHTPGHVVFHQTEQQLAFVGDVLFRGSIGRTDFERGNHADLINAIRTRLWALGDDVTFVPGHGPTSTFGEERQSNPYVADRLFSQAD